MLAMATVTQLSNTGFLAINGRDAHKFLQGYTTCDLDDVTPDASGIGAICNLQGRMVVSFRIVRTDEGFVLRLPLGLIETVRNFLQKYIVFSKAEMEDLSPVWRCYGVIGEVDLYPEGHRQVQRGDHSRVIRVEGPAPRYEIWAEGVAPDVSGLTEASEEDWMRTEIEAGVVWVHESTTETFIPQMFDYHRIGGIDFDKGCYLGQEIVARMQYRGKVNRKLFRGKGAHLAIGAELMAGGKAVGTVVAAAGADFLAVVQSKDDSVPAVEMPDGTALDLASIER